jgi:hypothetical protein
MKPKTHRVNKKRNHTLDAQLLRTKKKRKQLDEIRHTTPHHTVGLKKTGRITKQLRERNSLNLADSFNSISWKQHLGRWTLSSRHLSLSTRCGRQYTEEYTHGSRLSVEVRKTTN